MQYTSKDNSDYYRIKNPQKSHNSISFFANRYFPITAEYSCYS